MKLYNIKLCEYQNNKHLPKAVQPVINIHEADASEVTRVRGEYIQLHATVSTAFANTIPVVQYEEYIDKTLVLTGESIKNDIIVMLEDCIIENQRVEPMPISPLRILYSTFDMRLKIESSDA